MVRFNNLILTFIFCCVSFWAVAQKNIPQNKTYPIDQQIATSIFNPNANPIFSEAEATNYLYKSLKLPREVELILDTIITSPFGIHYTYYFQLFGIEVFKSQAKINTDKSGNIRSVLHNYNKQYNTNLKEFKPIHSNQLFNTIPSILLTKNKWYFDGKSLTPTTEFIYSFDKDNVYRILVSNTEEIVCKENLKTYFSATDTTATGTIFRPDPLTTSGNYYGAPYADNQDNNFSQLNNERDTVDLEVTFENDTFLLQNDFVKINEHSNPVDSPVTSTTGSFMFERAASGFEDVNVLYHITTFQRFIRSLGFIYVVNYRINADTHGEGGNDNSSFISFFTPPRLAFGEGGVDDAEDADVIIHEYGHAIMHSVAPGTNNGTQRQTLDEAIGDYFAASYSKSINPFRWEDVYTWDGHNEFWNGRFATSTKHYPEDLDNNLYLDAEIWSSTLMQIEEDLDRATVNQLMIQAGYSFASNMSLEDAAHLIYDADVLINGGANFFPICQRFTARGLFNACPNSISETNNISTTYSLYNSAGFAFGKTPLTIRFNHQFKGKLTVRAITGQIILSKPINHLAEINLSPNNFTKGTYWVELQNEAESHNFLISR